MMTLKEMFNRAEKNKWSMKKINNWLTYYYDKILPEEYEITSIKKGS